MKRITLLLIAALAIQLTASSQKVRIAAAANLRYVLEEIKKQYEKEHPRTKVEITFGASGTLTQLILNGAAYDFFYGR